MSESPGPEAKIIDAIYRGACDSTELARALELIAEHFDSPGVVVGELDQARPNSPFVVGVRTFNQEYFLDYAEYAEFDPAPRAVAAMAVGTAEITSRIFSDHVRRTNIFLNEFFVPRGVDGTLASPLLSSGGRFALIGVFQSINRRRYGDDDIARLERLTPHLTRSLQIRHLFLQSETRAKVLESIAGRNTTAMIALNGGGPALFVNDAARALAAARDGIALDRHGRLVVADRAAATRLAALYADVERGGPGGIVRIARPSHRQPYVALVSPLPAGDGLFPNSTGGVLFAIHDPARRSMPSEQLIAQLLHIPPGAAKVVQALLEGVELKDYADRAGISMNTVKFHLKTAFARTETRSQADLVRVAQSALHELGPYFSERK